MAKKLKLPFIERAGENFKDKSATKQAGPVPACSGTEAQPCLQNGKTAGPAQSRPELGNVLLVIDQRMSMYYSSKQKMKSVIAAEAAALIAWHAFAQKDRVGGIVFNDHEMAVLSPNYGRVQIMLMLHDLLNLNHRLSSNSERKSNPGMLNHALRRVATAVEGNSQIVLVTDGSGQDQVTGQILQSISEHNELIVFLVYDPRQVECANGNRSKPDNRMSFLQNSNRSCLFAGGTLTIPLNNQLDAVDQFRRGFRKLLRRRRMQNKQLKISQHDGHQVDQAGATAERSEVMEEPAISRLPSPLGTPQPICAQLNSR